MGFGYWEYIAYLVLGVLCVSLNSMEITLIIKNRKLMKTFDLILLSLAFADFTVGVSIFIMAIYSKNHGKDFTLKAGDSTSYFIFAIKLFAIFSSIMNILGISLDRVLAVKVPIKHKVWMSCENAKWVILGIWSTSLVLTLIALVLQLAYSKSLYNNDNFSPALTYTFATTILLFGVIFMIIYSYIVWRVVLRKSEFNERYKGCARICKIAKQRNLVLTCILVVSTYMGCTYPVAIATIAKSGNQKSLAWMSIMFLLNSSLDPFVYFLKGYLDQRAKKLKSSDGSTAKIKLTSSSESTSTPDVNDRR